MWIKKRTLSFRYMHDCLGIFMHFFLIFLIFTYFQHRNYCSHAICWHIFVAKFQIFWHLCTQTKKKSFNEWEGFFDEFIHLNWIYVWLWQNVTDYMSFCLCTYQSVLIKRVATTEVDPHTFTSKVVYSYWNSLYVNPPPSNVQGGLMRIPIFLGKGVFLGHFSREDFPKKNLKRGCFQTNLPRYRYFFQKLPEKSKKKGKGGRALIIWYICGREPRG